MTERQGQHPNITDKELLAAFQKTSGSTNEMVENALLAETERPNLDI